MDRNDIEDFVFGLADILYENRRLRAELEEAKEYKRKYDELLDQSVKTAGESQKAILEAILAGVFAPGNAK